METRKTYIAPRLTVVSFKVERGYAESLTFFTALPVEEPYTEDYSVHDGWGSGNSNTFWD